MNFQQRVEGAKRFRQYILNRDRWICYICNAKLDASGTDARGTIDHLVPVSRGGARYSSKNVRACCRTCNVSKGCLTFDEYEIVLLYRQGLIEIKAAA